MYKYKCPKCAKIIFYVDIEKLAKYQGDLVVPFDKFKDGDKKPYNNMSSIICDYCAQRYKKTYGVRRYKIEGAILDRKIIGNLI